MDDTLQDAPCVDCNTNSSAQQDICNDRSIYYLEDWYDTLKTNVHTPIVFQVAVKIIDKKQAQKDKYVAKNMRREARILQMVCHPNVVQLLEVVETENRCVWQYPKVECEPWGRWTDPHLMSLPHLSDAILGLGDGMGRGGLANCSWHSNTRHQWKMMIKA